MKMFLKIHDCKKARFTLYIENIIIRLEPSFKGDQGILIFKE